MTLTLTYDDTDPLGRVRIEFSGYSVSADYAIVERSRDSVNWEVIRGGDQVGVSAGAGSIDDYEFRMGGINYYRVSAVDTAGPSFISVGAAAHADNASVTPGLPAGGSTTGDLLVMFACSREFASTPVAPFGWTALFPLANVQIYGKIRGSSESAPTVTLTGGTAGCTNSAQIAAFRNVSINLRTMNQQFNSTAQNIAFPYIQTSGINTLGITFGWKQDDWTGVAPLSGWTETMDTSSTLGNDQGITMNHQIPFVSPLLAGEFVVTGGATAFSRGGTMVFEAGFTNQETGNITPTTTKYRIKNIGRPGLNTVIEPVGPPIEITRPARTGLFDVLGRTMPVAVTDVQGSHRFTLMVDVPGLSSRKDMDNRLSSGEPMYLEAPTEDDQIPTVYFVAGDVGNNQDVTAGVNFTFSIPVTEVAKPGSAVLSSTTVWADIIADFASWSALIAAEATWSDVISRISDSDVIVP